MKGKFGLIEVWSLINRFHNDSTRADVSVLSTVLTIPEEPK